MPLIPTEDGEYLFAIDDHNDTRNGRPQWVVYRGDPALGNVVADRHGYEAGLGEDRPPSVVRPGPGGGSPVPSPAAGGGRVIRITQDSDGQFVPRMYSYWSNAVVSGDQALVFAGHVDGSARFFQVNLSTGGVTRIGSLMPYRGTTEGWYWDADGWLYICEGPRLHRLHLLTGADHIAIDISDRHPGCDLWQAHSSDDGRTHSATVRQIVSDGAYPKVGTVVIKDGAYLYFAAEGVLDESQVSRDGAYLVIKERGDDNRIVTLGTGEERWLTDAEGALGHSDCGPDFMVGEDNQIGACVRVDLRTLARRVLFKTWNMGYVSERGGRCLLSDQTHLSLVALDGSGVTILIPHGGSSDYDGRVKANLSPCGRVATFMKPDGSVYLLELP